MDLFGLNGYSLEKRAKLVEDRGAFITSRRVGPYSLSLYHMGDFFAEVWLIVETNKLVLVRGFGEEAYPDAYLNTIDVSELMG